MFQGRRNILQFLAAGMTLAPLSSIALANYRAHKKNYSILIIGGGIAGSTFARTLRRLTAKVDITIIEENTRYYSGPISAEYIVGKRSEESISFDYERLKQEGISIIHDRAISIDSDLKIVKTTKSIYAYDKCIIACGIGFDYKTFSGYSEEVSTLFPHAWHGGAQLNILKKQLHEMPNGGTVLMTAPNTEYRCPPGPYERASQIAEFLKVHKPNSKLIFLDAKERFPKQQQFELAWKKLYNYGTNDSYITWIGSAQGGTVTEIRVDTKELVCEAGIFKGDVINIIPNQKAENFAHENGLTGTNGWCPVNTRTLESKKNRHIYVIGDSADARSLPKSAFAATCQARVCALSIYSLVSGIPLPPPEYMNVCFSLCGTDYGISVVVNYLQNPKTNTIDTTSINITPLDSPSYQYVSEALSAYTLFKNIVKEAFG